MRTTDQSHSSSTRDGGAIRSSFVSKAHADTAPELEKVMALAILAASAILAPIAMAVLNQAAQIIAR